MSKPCIVIAIFTPKPEKSETVLQVLSDTIPLVHQEVGCELYALHEDVDGRFVLIEKWTSREDWRVHVGLPSVANLHKNLDGLLERDVEVLEMYGQAVGTLEQGTL
jgi:quinol monooxygenase YgiN